MVKPRDAAASARTLAAVQPTTASAAASTSGPVAAAAQPSTVQAGAASSATSRADEKVVPGASSATPQNSAHTPALNAPANPDLLAAYRRQLGELFARHQAYPRLAALRGWEGEVRVRLKVARKGSLLAVQLDRSSGFDVLDRHALAMLGELAALPALPEGLASDELQLVVPILYKLNKTT